MSCYGSIVVVHVGLVGRLRIGAGGRWLDDAGMARHDRLVLAYLAVERARWVSREELADLVWEHRVPVSWKTALRGVASRVRAALAGVGLTDVLITGPGWYELRLPDATEVDIESAAADLAMSQRLLAEGDPAGAHDAAESALRVARQPFLPGVQALWVEQRQELLEELRLRALEVVADAALESGDWAAARGAAEQAVVLAPLRESVYRRLALAHSGTGDRGEALRVLARCRDVLAEEVGADVSPETEALLLVLLRGQAVPAARMSPRPGSSRTAMSAQAVPAAQVSRMPGVALPPRLTDRSTAFVNRAGELATLRAAWERAIAGAPEMVLVVGEAGAGKTRLVAEFSAAVAGVAATVLYGRGDEAGPVGPGPLMEALRAYRTGPADSVANPAATAETVRAALARLATNGPVLLVLDDLQWVHQATFAMLRYALRDPLPLLVASTYRTGEPRAAQRLTSLVTRLRRECPVSRIDLAGLAPAEVGSLVESCIGVPAEPALVSAIADATAGNPFFVHELLLLLAEQATAARRGGALMMRGFSVPEGVRDVILARYQRLPPPARRVLAAAAVCGREVELATLELMPDLSRVDVLGALEDAVGSHVMVERTDHIGRFAFVHGLVQETLYQDLSAVRRQRLHLDVAAVLELRQGGPSVLAYHLLRGGPAAAERATIAAARAGAEALRRHAYEEAVTDYSAALEVAGTNPAVQCRLRLELAGARWRAGDTATARRDYEAAAADAAAAGRTDLAVRAVFGAVGNGPTLGRCDERAVEHLTTVLDVVAPRDPFKPRLLARLATELAGVGDGRAVGLCEQALELAEAFEDRSTVAYVLNCRSWAGLDSASDADGPGRADRMVALAEAVGDRHMMLEGRLWRCTHHLRAGRLAAAEEEITALEQVAVDLRQPFYLRMPLRLRACLALARRQLDEAERFAAEAYTVERRVHPADAEVHALIHAVALSHARDRWHDLGSRLADAVAAEPHAPHWRACHAVQLAATDRAAQAVGLLRPLLADDASALRRSPLTAFTLSLVSRACASSDELARGVDVGAVHRVLLPRRGSHAVAGCAVASLGPIDRFLPDRL